MGRHREEEPAYLEWIRRLPCAVRGRYYRLSPEGKAEEHRCRGSVQAHHTVSRGAMGPDRTTIPLCDTAHRQWHEWGRFTWQRRYGCDAKALVAALRAKYQPEEVAF